MVYDTNTYDPKFGSGLDEEEYDVDDDKRRS